MCDKLASAYARAGVTHMGLELRDSMSEVWEKWQGQEVNGKFRVRRYLGGSDHSEVLLGEFLARDPAQAAFKLIPASPSGAEAQLAAWRSAAALAHPHLIRIVESGRCELGERPCLYVAMEYADQTLAELLKNRALTEEEARELLVPTLSALTFLHSRNLVHGELKPTNILAVGEQLKLSSDTIRRAGENAVRRGTRGAYDPPETLDGRYTAAGDIWALGVTLCEALTRALPAGEESGEVLPPRDLPASFQQIVASCLNRRPEGRPTVRDLDAWMRGVSAPSAPASRPAQPAAAAQPMTIDFVLPQPFNSEPAASAKPAAKAQLPEPARVPVPAPVPTPAAAPAPKVRSYAPLILGAVVVLVVGWAVIAVLRSHRAPAAPAVQVVRDSALQTPSQAGSALPDRPPPPVSTPVTSTGTQGRPVAVPAVLHEEIPNVSQRARQTIRGHVRVSVRVMVDAEGTVVAALVDNPGPSRYFERLAIDAAKKWTFPPAETQARRLKVLRFEFSRQGTTGRAISLK
jgi:TonB family protein